MQAAELSHLQAIAATGDMTINKKQKHDTHQRVFAHQTMRQTHRTEIIWHTSDRDMQHSNLQAIAASQQGAQHVPRGTNGGQGEER